MHQHRQKEYRTVSIIRVNTRTRESIPLPKLPEYYLHNPYFCCCFFYIWHYAEYGTKMILGLRESGKLCMRNRPPTHIFKQLSNTHIQQVSFHWFLRQMTHRRLLASTFYSSISQPLDHYNTKTNNSCNLSLNPPLTIHILSSLIQFYRFFTAHMNFHHCCRNSAILENFIQQ